MTVDYQLASEASIRVLSEADLAAWCREQGMRVVEHRGRFWRQLVPGFLEGVHTLSRMTAYQATRPTPFCWGYRAALEESSASAANGFVPMFLVRDLSSYNEMCLARKRREDLRQCLRNTAIVHLTDSALLEQQGYDIYLSYAKRLKVTKVLQRAAYVRMIRSWFADSRRLVLAGLAGDQLLGYEESWAVEGTLYVSRIHVSSNALRTNINAGLYYETLQAYKRSGQVHEASAGLYHPGNPGLESFKRSLGFEPVGIPARCSMLPLMARYVRRTRPYAYYHMTGRSS